MKFNSTERKKKIKKNDLNLEEKLELFNKLQGKFIKDYPVEKINNLKLDEYVMGKGSTSSFCYRLESELKELGSMRGSTSRKFGIYYGKEGKDRTSQYRLNSRYGSTIEETFADVKMSIYNLLKAGENNDRDKIINNKLAPLFRYKLLATYFPNKFINIYSGLHLDYFLSKLGIKVDSNEVYDKQLSLLEFKKADKIHSTKSNDEFNSFLHDTYGQPPRNGKGK